MLNSTLKFAKKENRPKWILNGFLCIFKLIRMKAWLATCKPLILLDFHRSFNDTPDHIIGITSFVTTF